MTPQTQRRPGATSAIRRLPVRQIDFALALLFTIAGLVLFAYTGIGGNSRSGFAFLENIELRSLDFRFALRGERSHDDRIVIVDIDERTLQKLGSFPIPRSAYAQLTDKLHDAGASVIAFDATFPVPANESALTALDELQKDLGKTASPATRKRIAEIRSATDQDALFAAAMKRAGNVVLGHLFLDRERAKLSDPKLEEEYFNIAWGKEYPQIQPVKKAPDQIFDLNRAWTDSGGMVAFGAQANIAKLAEAAASYGFIDINTDPDGTLRHALLIMRYRDQDYFPSLAVQALREYEKIPDQDVVVYIAENGLERIQCGKRVFRPKSDGTELINYAGPFGTYRHISMIDVIDGNAPAAELKNKIVFVGPTAKAIGDLRNTPFSNLNSAYMGVEVHANILDNLLHYGEPSRTFLVRGLREEYIDMASIVLFGLGLGYFFNRMRPFYATLVALLALAAFATFVYGSFAVWGRWLSFIIPAGTLVATYASITSFRTIFEEGEKRKIRETFGQFVAPSVIALMEREPEKYNRMGGETKELTMMFTDIRGFTTLSEGMEPNELVEWLNEYLTEMTDILFRNFGMLDKYIGDAVMAFWGFPYVQPDHAIRACKCGLEMQHRLVELNRKWRQDGKKEIGIGVGINTGPVNVGKMGSVKRASWTVLGDNVNLASRLEGLTKEYRLQIILSESTYAQVASEFVCRELDQIRVKGKKQPVRLYELLGFTSERAQFEELINRFGQAMRAYHEQDWGVASGRFGEILADFPEDGPTQIFLQRSLEFLQEAPEPGWDGVYVMKTK